MAKIFSVVTILLALGAAYFGYETKGRIEKLQSAAEKEHTDLKSTESKLKSTKEKLTATEEERDAAKSDYEKATASLRTAEADLAKAKADVAAATEEHEKTKVELADLKKKIEDMAPKTGGGDLKAQIDAMNAKVTELETKNRELEIVKSDLTTRVETIQENAKGLQAKVATQATTINRYEKGVMLQGTRGRVLAVNAGWGFCVLSIGDRQGAAANKTMIVTRGGQAIGKVKIINVEVSQSVADIIPSSFAAGTYVQPGDEVIFRGEDRPREEQAGDGSGSAPAGGSAGSPALPER